MRLLLFLPALWLTLLTACSGEDRSGEVPYAPQVRTLRATPLGNTCRLWGQVLSSPNSRLLGCGFVVIGDTLTRQIAASDTTWQFAAVADSLAAGHYRVVAYARNGIGTTTATDTLTFTIYP